MVAVYTGSTQYVTALTLALLEDSGWYRSNYAVAQNSPFGLGSGCEFVEEKCIKNGVASKWAAGTFCDSAASIGCTPDKHLVAYCDLSKWDGNLPSGYQYFMDPVGIIELGALSSPCYHWVSIVASPRMHTSVEIFFWFR